MEVPPNGRGEPVGVIETQYRRRGQPPCSDCGSQVASPTTLTALSLFCFVVVVYKPRTAVCWARNLEVFLCCSTGLWFRPSCPLTGLQLALLRFNQPFMSGVAWLTPSLLSILWQTESATHMFNASCGRQAALDDGAEQTWQATQIL